MIFKAEDLSKKKYFIGSIKNQLENQLTKEINVADYLGITVPDEH
jgi:hypothetical protein